MSIVSRLRAFFGGTDIINNRVVLKGDFRAVTIATRGDTVFIQCETYLPQSRIKQVNEQLQAALDPAGVRAVLLLPGMSIGAVIKLVKDNGLDGITQKSTDEKVT